MPVKLAPYVSTMNPTVHLQAYHVAMQIANILDGKKCKLFPPTLGQEGLNWYTKLPDHSIDCFSTLEEEFLKRYATSIVYKKPTTVINGL